MSLTVVAKEFQDSKFSASFAVLMTEAENGGRGYNNVRRLRRDGNCFYRSFLFQLFEHYALVLAGVKPDPSGNYQVQYKALIERVEASKKDMVDNAGYDEIVIEDFYECFIEELKKLEGLKGQWEEANKLAGDGA